jgi:uncharacterized protein (DUF1499 family)
MIFLGAIFCLIVLMLITLGIMSQKVPELGLKDGKLRPCPNKPNCVCSEAYAGTAGQNVIEPVAIDGRDADNAWQALRAGILAEGGKIENESGLYLHATFTSPVFRFVDDVEARLDRHAMRIHLRSASRIGHSDMGVNRRRIRAILNNQ